MRVSKAVGLCGLILVTGVLLIYASLRLGLWNTSYAAMKAKYAGPPSVFMTVDGVPMHVREEGRGPLVVMLHGSIVSLHEWDPVVERLKARYRIVRIDWPPYGVSGPDPKGVYTTKRAADLVSGVVDGLHLPPFDLVSTSNGVNVALQYAADHPDHVKAMAFSIPPLERPSQTRKTDPRIVRLGKFFAAWLPNYHPKFWYRLIVKDTTAPGFQPPPALIDMIYDMDNLPGAAARQAAFLAANATLFRTTDVGAVAGTVHVPVLIQWCSLDTVISQSAGASVARFTRAPVQLITYPDVGHFPMWEDPDRFSADLGRFLDRVEGAAP
jgi:pimeloyl-ACP methyl ester carboxylesterase